VLTPAGFAALEPLYVSLAKVAPHSVAWLSAARWSLAMLLVVVPTMAMGATLPVLCAGLEADGDGSSGARENRLGRLYAANTLGGAVGALLAAYWILPTLGLSGTLFASAALSATLGVGAIVASRFGDGLAGLASSDRGDRGATEAESKSRRPLALSGAVSGVVPARSELLLLTGLAWASGALVFTAEVIFTHLLALIIGNSVYAFGLILAIFLCCLFLGAAGVERVRARWGEQALTLSLGATALALSVTVPLWDQLPLLFNNTGEFLSSFEAREATRAFCALFILIVPTTLMGLTFPLLLQRVAKYAAVGALVGRLTAVNTLGAVLGSLGAGYWLLPVLGSEKALLFVALCFAGLGLGTAVVLGVPRRPVLWVTGLALLAALALPRWNLAKLTAGTNVYFSGAQPADQILMLHEDVQGGVTSVAEANGVRTLYTNGKFQGNTGWEMNAQRYFAHYPTLFTPRFDHALVIGLGTGTTTGTMIAYPWQSLEVVEISQSIVNAARDYFGDVNHHALDDPRVHLVIADGRNHLMLTDRRYDLITIELSSIWFAGASSLYNSEFYDLVAQRLAPGGVLQQWVQLHHVSERDFATILHTIRTHFPHMALYYGGGQGIVVASLEPLRASQARALRFQQDPRVQPTLPEAIEPGGTIVRRELASLVDDALLADEDLDRFLESAARKADLSVDALVSNDDNLYLEYATPRGNVLPWSARDELVRTLQSFRRQELIDALRAP
ncbi:MAG TPA: fused MFS/spermidine synthase, partial [Polyangiaceae bacterium]|nr:fused MFS/spermidine synthase [Polyangiaceae bacterium]